MLALGLLCLMLSFGLLGLFVALRRAESRLHAAQKDLAETERARGQLAQIAQDADQLRSELTAAQLRLNQLADTESALASARADVRRFEREVTETRDRFSAITRLEDAAAQKRAELDALTHQIESERERSSAELYDLRLELERLHREVGVLDEVGQLQSFGLYQPIYDFGTSESYKAKLEEVRRVQASMLKEKTAATCARKWVVDGSTAKGQQMVDRQLKLMLRAFNGDCDAAIAKVRFNNVVSIEARLRKSFEAINKLGEPNQCELAASYLDLKIEELRLTYELAEKLQEERAEQRRIREQMREEELVRREREERQREAELEEERAARALEKARAELLTAGAKERSDLEAKVALLESKLAAAHAATERAVSLAQLTRAGAVYVISNEGSFGPNIFKIGMSRRENPQERVDELGSASVPFAFDIHAMIRSDDAPALENRLHKLLAKSRVNLVNERKEFFSVTLAEIEEAVAQCHEAKVEFTRLAVAEEWRKTLAVRHQRAANTNSHDAKAPIPPPPLRARVLG